MSDLAYILVRIEEGARVRLSMDYFGQHIAVVPRRWLLGKRRIKLDQHDASQVERALRSRRHQAKRLPQEATAAKS